MTMARPQIRWSALGREDRICGSRPVASTMADVGPLGAMTPVLAPIGHSAQAFPAHECPSHRR